MGVEWLQLRAATATCKCRAALDLGFNTAKASSPRIVTPLEALPARRDEQFVCVENRAFVSMGTETYDPYAGNCCGAETPTPLAGG